MYLKEQVNKAQIEEMYWLKAKPPFEPLQSDPRWEALMDKVGFPGIIDFRSAISD